MTPADSGGPNIFEFEMSPSLFQMKDMGKTLKINTIWLLARCAAPLIYKVEMMSPLPVDSNTFSLKVDQYFGLHLSQKDVSALRVKVVPNDPPILWRLQMTGPSGANLDAKEVEDLIIVLGYQFE